MSPAATAVRLVDQFRSVPIGTLVPSPTNPRKSFDAEKLKELAASILEKGVIAPIVVRHASLFTVAPPAEGFTRWAVINRHGVTLSTHATDMEAEEKARELTEEESHGQLEIVDGERRYRAALSAGLSEVPVIVRALRDQDVLEIQLIANIQRDDLEPLEEAKGYRALIDSNPARYSVHFIADRIGRSDKFVWDRMKLLDLIPTAAALLETGRILVGHAERLARLKPEDQARAIAPEGGGLFVRETTLAFTDPDDTTPREPDPYEGLKAVSVKEFDAWIATHVRFDVAHAAEAAPLDFGPVAERVQTAVARPGRGKKVVHITHLQHIADSAKVEGERTFGPRSWKRADSSSSDAPACEFAVLGVVVVGPEYTRSFDVCIARDKCDVHWKTERQQRERDAEPSTASSAQTPAASAPESFEEQERKRRARDARDQAAFEKFIAVLLPAIEAKLPSKLDRRLFEFLSGGRKPNVPPSQFIATLVRDELQHLLHWHGNKPTLVKWAKHFGVDVKRVEARAQKTDDAPGAAVAKKKGR